MNQAALRRSLQRLAPVQRESIVLAYYAGLSTAEISRQLNVNRLDRHNQDPGRFERAQHGPADRFWNSV